MPSITDQSVLNFLSKPVIKKIWYGFFSFLYRPKVSCSTHKIRVISWGSKIPQIKKPIPKIIWTYWEGPPSPSALACQKSWEENCGNYQIITLSDESISQFLEDFPKTPKNLPVQLKSDLVRLLLLERYGGIWIDHSVILTQSLHKTLRFFEKKNYDILAFYNESSYAYKKNHARPIIENGFIAAKKGADFIRKWRIYHQECVLSGKWKGYYRNFPNYSELIENFVTKDKDLIDYLTCYISAQRVMLNRSKSKLVLINSEDEYYFYQNKISRPLKTIKTTHILLLSDKENAACPALIKLTKENRLFIDEYINNKCFIKTSILGQHI